LLSVNAAILNRPGRTPSIANVPLPSVGSGASSLLYHFSPYAVTLAPTTACLLASTTMPVIAKA
jgi:hypothetical protein